MKQTILFFVIAAFAMMSCEDMNTIDIDTNLNKTIVAEITKPAEGNLLKASNSYDFSATDTLNLKDNEDLYDYINRINELNVTSANLKLNGIPTGEFINELSIIIAEAGIDICPTCGSKELEWGGTYTTTVNKYSAFRCKSCGAIGRSRHSELDRVHSKAITQSIAR